MAQGEGAGRWSRRRQVAPAPESRPVQPPKAGGSSPPGARQPAASKIAQRPHLRPKTNGRLCGYWAILRGRRERLRCRNAAPPGLYVRR